ncbi:MAG TPA: shikimate dehydrogenase [Alphaproteobacteria bacterium]|nr:shikimate dehydrogenase [Alphaproteobacteria bacterium]
MMLSGKARVAGIIGWPVAHSLSPRLHNFWLEKHGIDGAYVPLPVAPEHFSQSLRVLAHMGFAGVNVTVPHKEAALKAVDQADPAARRIGAVNTVVVRRDGSLYGANTDGSGFIAHLAQAAADFDPAAAPAVVIGAGGAARALVAALMDAGTPEVRLSNRTLARAEELAVGLGGGVRVINWVDRAHALEDAGILVNATTQGMTGQQPLKLDLSRLPGDAVVYDIVYTPERTPLLREAAARGNPAIGGLGMLLHQAVPGFKAWFGIEPEVDEDLTAHVRKGLT